MSDWLANLSYERRGSGSPLVLLHGIGHRWQAWEPVLDQLARHHDVIALDLPGFGASPSMPRPYTMPNAVEAMDDVFTVLGVSRPHVAGNSLGGAIALELASAGLVGSATAFAPAGFWSPRDRAWALHALQVVRLGGHVPSSLRAALVNVRLLRLLCGCLLFGRPASLRAETMLEDIAAMVTAPAFEPVAATGRDYVFASPPPTVPVTVAWGERDRVLWPRQARKAAELLPEARHVTLPCCGHVPMQDDPALVTRIILDTCAEAGVPAGARPGRTAACRTGGPGRLRNGAVRTGTGRRRRAPGRR